MKEQMQTIVIEAEGVLTKRQLRYVHDDSHEPLPVTPTCIIGGIQSIHKEYTAAVTCPEGVGKKSRERTATWWEKMAAGIPSRVKKCKLESLG